MLLLIDDVIIINTWTYKKNEVGNQGFHGILFFERHQQLQQKIVYDKARVFSIW